VPSAAGRTFGRFRVLELIGRGGMGCVYRAERTDGLDQKVALKLLRADVLGRASRIERETRTLARLQHPAIAQFVDAGVEADGTAWIAMELTAARPSTRSARPAAFRCASACACWPR
jgi:eukaryotic-like serine/threonine-protein kinase